MGLGGQSGESVELISIQTIPILVITALKLGEFEHILGSVRLPLLQTSPRQRHRPDVSCPTTGPPSMDDRIHQV